MDDRVSNEALLTAALGMLEAQGTRLKKLKTSSRAMKFELPDGKTVRARTCNDHVLVVLADSPGPGATLNIEGTDHLLIAMPATPRTAGAVIAYFVPTQVAVKAVRQSHAEWLASGPSTRGNNRTWNIWFDDQVDVPWSGFARKWSKYRIAGSGSTDSALSTPSVSLAGRTLGSVIAEARAAIASAAGVSPDLVKISIDLG
jgi:hypothetical protein